ncbi:hypothetical protein TNIN_290551 [Trichonephila inaurata madagascariensis]|uniref:Uncharacterized protein n=1 Tax=Trichonephila inaurata madagascariensis TaxID=2747483 RepID=A0A8X7C6T8_9ARAC|nr:hypothetical protein TNIN_290551 [Trichonephila inaurata madagascariensis]
MSKVNPGRKSITNVIANVSKNSYSNLRGSSSFEMQPPTRKPPNSSFHTATRWRTGGLVLRMVWSKKTVVEGICSKIYEKLIFLPPSPHILPSLGSSNIRHVEYDS